MKSSVSSHDGRDVTNSLVCSQRWRSILMALYITLDDLPHGISSTRVARECRELSFSLPRLVRAMSLQSRATLVQSLREKSHITSDGLETHRANTVTAIRTELNRFRNGGNYARHSSIRSFSITAFRGASVYKRDLRAAAPCDGEFFWWIISPGNCVWLIIKRYKRDIP